jgi:hypothetical protein
VIFVDTSFFYALFATDDEDHGRAFEVFKEFHGRHLPAVLVTTDIAVMETITLARRRSSHQQAAFIGERLYSEKIARIHRTTFDEQRAAFEYFKRYADKEYSSVDCLSFVVMDSLGITEALAIDSDFTHRFTARPGPLRR